MNITKNDRRQFLQKFGILSVAAGAGSMLSQQVFGYSGAVDQNESLISLSPSALFSVLDLDLPELAAVKKALDKKGNDAALAELLKYYRRRYPKPDRISRSAFSESEKRSISRADDLGRHIFQWGPYAPAGYGENIDWAADPAGDIEWVANVYRFQWANDLGNWRRSFLFIFILMVGLYFERSWSLNDL